MGIERGGCSPLRFFLRGGGGCTQANDIKRYSLEYFFFEFKYANVGDKGNKVKPYMVCQINKNGSIQINRVSSQVPYLLLRSSRSSLRSSTLTEIGQGCHLEVGAGDFSLATMNVLPRYFQRKI